MAWQLLQPGHGRRRRARSDGKRGDVLLVMLEGALVLELSVMHTVADTYVQDAAMTGGGAAMVHGARKEVKCSRGQAGGGYAFEPIVFEMYGRLGEAAVKLLKRLGHIAAESDKVDKDLFMVISLQELSVLVNVVAGAVSPQQEHRRLRGRTCGPET